MGCKSAKYYRENPEARKHKARVDKAINSRPEQIKKRVESNKARTEAKKKGKDISGKDFDHAIGAFVSSSTNRGRTVNGQREGKRK